MGTPISPSDRRSMSTARGQESSIGIEAETAVGDQRLLQHRGDRQEPDRRKKERRCNKDQAFAHDPGSTQRFKSGWIS
jgi:hypothetical protein